MVDQPTRILRLIVRLNIAGPTHQAILLASAMDELNYETTLVVGGSPDETDSMAYLTADYGVEPLFVDALRPYLNPVRNVVALWALYRLMRQLRPDIVHTHTTTAGFLGRIAARLARVPIVVHTLHTHPFEGYYNRWRTRLFVVMERIGARLSDSIIALSENLRRELVETRHITSKKRITVLPLGFDLETFAKTQRQRGAFRADWDVAHDAPLVGIVGRLWPVKNHALFLEAAARVRDQLPAARFVIVGDGLLRDKLEAHAQSLGIRDAVIFTGWQQHLEDIFSDLDVLVISSTNEGTPVPIIEALAAGCPVVATRVGGIPDLLDGGKWGDLVPSGNATALAEAVVRVIKHPPDTSEAQQVMLNRYDIQRLAHDLDSLYRGLQAKRKHQTQAMKAIP